MSSLDHAKSLFKPMLRDFEKLYAAKLVYFSPTIKNAMLYRHCISPHTLVTIDKDVVIELAFLASEHYTE